MLRTVKYFPSLCSQFVGRCDPSLSAFNLTKSCVSRIKQCAVSGVNYFGTGEPRMLLRKETRKGTRKGKLLTGRQATGGESTDIFEASKKKDYLPSVDLPDRLFNDVPFKELPIVNVSVSPNNTIMSLTDCDGVTLFTRSCGMEGFKNVKKGTNIAAQATAISFSSMALERGYKTVRVRVRGLGPGRLSAVRGMIMGGMDIVSITDNTRVSDDPPRPKKLRRI